jgi:hypothetical protein
MSEADRLRIAALAAENSELRAQLAHARDLVIENAINAGHLQARIEALEARLTKAERDRDKWKVEAEAFGAGYPRNTS